jgi:heme/copper-type cytochrome/quinol oxidase subunit 4|tara:strand:- start:1414 stop:1725 length:312 start_codon:yes stop_codon:yes gene_type:complete
MPQTAHTHTDDEAQTDSFLNGIMKAFFIVILTIILIWIRNKMATSQYFENNSILKYSIFCFIVIIFMMIMTGIQGSSFMSLMTIVIILISVTMIIWTTAEYTK